jgi:UDP-N-acetylglucosamine--N-acetylmuramyl-(pentapeptide) pyrophosphoryl-undecaprenol N-acetylglucosamine transferase
MSLRVIISGGGTGGHIFPAIAIAKAILRERHDAEILFVGAEGRMEMEKVPQAGFKIIGLPIMGIQRRMTLQNLKVPFKILASLLKARKIIREFKPDIAIGVGGYASGPLLRTASSMGVKTLIQEQNSYPGITNKILSKKAEKICVAYDNLDSFFPKEKIVLTGNPVRSEVTQIQNKKVEAFNHFDLNSDKPVLLVIGGSLGALTINKAIEKFAESLTARGLQIIWQTGKNFKSEKAHALPGVHAHNFIKEMDYAYAAADIIVSRAGAMSISELCLVKKPCILVPSPNVSEDHQTKNAMALVNKGAAVLVKDSEAINELEKAILELKADQDLCAAMSKNIAELGHPEADRLIASQVFKICGK